MEDHDRFYKWLTNHITAESLSYRMVSINGECNIMFEFNSAYKKNYIYYMDKIKQIDLDQLAPKLGIENNNPRTVLVYNQKFIITEQGFTNLEGEKPPYEICIILAKYILMCPDKPPTGKNLIPFRGFKDSGPLSAYISNDIEKRINKMFIGKTDALKQAAKKIGGYTPDITAAYDVIICFDAMPKIPVILLFNDRDEEFDAQVKLLFEQGTEKYLDVECISILCHLLCQQLKHNI